jgi:hypothetical protein
MGCRLICPWQSLRGAGVILAAPFWWPALAAAQTLGPNLLPAGNFASVTSTYVPWAGVDDKGNIHGLDGVQIAVGDDGSIRPNKFGPSVAVADLNGDGKPDLVLADSKGFFWFFPNSGSATQPAFTQGEIMPVWLGEPATNESREGLDNVVPRIQLVDFDRDKLLDIMAGTYAGKLFHIPNVGSASQPGFGPTYDRNALVVNTNKQQILWCNYLAPFFTDKFGLHNLGSGNPFDLVLGDGSYSANSIYLLRNATAGGGVPYDDGQREKIIPGMGLEQLTPVVVDWNNDGKPDIVTGARTGFLTLYLNNSTDPEHPTFAPGTHLKIAGIEKLGDATTVTVADLTGNHLPNLVIGKNDGTVLYALNTGTLGAPVFSTPATPLKGVFPPMNHYVSPNSWLKDQAWGVPDEVVACVNPQLEPGFAFPAGENSKYALKFSVWPIKNVVFPERYYPRTEDKWNEHVIRCTQRFILKLNTRYRVHFWVKGDRNVKDLRYRLSPGGAPNTGKAFRGYEVINPVDAGMSWTEATSDVEIDNPEDPTTTTWSYGFEFRFTGQATFYVDDVQIQEEK